LESHVCIYIPWVISLCYWVNPYYFSFDVSEVWQPKSEDIVIKVITYSGPLLLYFVSLAVGGSTEATIGKSFPDGFY